MPERPAAALSARGSTELEREQPAWRERMLRGVAWSAVTASTLIALWYIAVDRRVPQLIPVLLTLAVAGGSVL